MVPGCLNQQPAGVGIAGLGDRPLHPRRSRRALAGNQPDERANTVAGKPIPIYGDGSNIRDWLYVEDHCRGIERVIRRGRLGETYNIGGCNEWKNLDIVRLICSLLDERRPEAAPHDRLISFVTDRP